MKVVLVLTLLLTSAISFASDYDSRIERRAQEDQMESQQNQHIKAVNSINSDNELIFARIDGFAKKSHVAFADLKLSCWGLTYANSNQWCSSRTGECVSVEPPRGGTPAWGYGLMAITMPSLAIMQARNASEEAAQHAGEPANIIGCDFDLSSWACQINSCRTRCVDSAGNQVFKKAYSTEGVCGLGW